MAGVSSGAAAAGGVSAAAGSVRSASESARARFSSSDLEPVSEGALSACSPSGLACYDVGMWYIEITLEYSRMYWQEGAIAAVTLAAVALAAVVSSSRS